MAAAPLATLVLAGTAESRAVIESLKADAAFSLTASLAGATPDPIALPVPTRTGGFGGVDGLVTYAREQGVGLLIDATHPFARQISHNAHEAAARLGIPCLRLERPPWEPEEGDDWRSFDSWQEMADAIPAGARVFLAGGTQSIEIFTKREDIHLWARALKVEGRVGPPNTIFINAMPQSEAEERQTFLDNGITLLCCKNSGGAASFAKIAAARSLGLSVWMLARHRPDMGQGMVQGMGRGMGRDGTGDAAGKQVANYHIHDTVEAIVAAARQVAGQEVGQEAGQATGVVSAT